MSENDLPPYKNENQFCKQICIFISDVRMKRKGVHGRIV